MTSDTEQGNAWANHVLRTSQEYLRKTADRLEGFDLFDPKRDVTQFTQPRSLRIAEELINQSNPPGQTE
ncbi:hypothetical protein EBT31_15515 [bacterium]|nr:hypothetical protein [bacterium]